jgi:hypothetical protein
MSNFRGDPITLWDSLASLPLAASLVDDADGVPSVATQNGIGVTARGGIVEIWRDDALDLEETKAELDLDTPSADLDTIVRAKVGGVAGNSITVAAVADNDALTKASLAMAGPSTLCDTVIEAAVGGADGNDATIAFVADGTGAGTLDESGWPVVVFHYETAVTTVTNFESAISGSTNLDVKTGGTGANILEDPGDTFAATSLAGGLDSEGVTLVEGATTCVIHYVDGESTVGDVETAIAADSNLIEVKTAGTGATVLTGADAFSATALAGGAAETDLTALLDFPLYLYGYNGSSWVVDETIAAADVAVGRDRGVQYECANAGLYERLALIATGATVPDAATIKAIYTPIRD